MGLYVTVCAAARCTVSDTAQSLMVAGVWIGYGVAALFIVANSRPEAIFHQVSCHVPPWLPAPHLGQLVVSLSGAMSW
jgi:hypothetical protein